MPSDQDEIRKLKAQAKQLEVGKKILKKSAGFIAKETD